MNAQQLKRTSLMSMGVAATALTLAACGGGSQTSEPTPAPTATATVATPTPAATPTAAAAPTVDSTDTLDGTTLASLTGDAAAGQKVFAVCSTCHAVQAGVNKIGPSLAGIVGRAAGTVEGYSYSTANKNSGITWSKEKLFQYLEKPQRVVPGTKMAYAGLTDAQKRADLIAYLDTL
ncbi:MULTISPECIES: c-type cytochrome [unclassified Sphingomonas]|jgi:cytochrome c|uniref:c-type cytochrome n=1 Tax=unclassified Sphingomonas TaxID=196159 RepID=UPI000A60D4A6|nr:MULTISPECIES: cytochrome c family protein [unclassified Sphingomonas]